MSKKSGEVIELIPNWPNVRCDKCRRVSVIEPNTPMDPWSCPLCKYDHFSTLMRK
jgi:hypothetical protein